MYNHAVVRSLLLIVSLSFVASEPLHVARQSNILPLPINPPSASSSAAPSVTTPQTPTTQASPTTSQTPTTLSTPTTQSTSSSTAPTTPTNSPPTSTTPTSAASTSTTATSQSSASSSDQSSNAQVSTIASTSTDAQGQVTTVIVTSPADSSSSSSSSASPTPTNSSSGSDNSLGSGAIIGLSVAGGVAAIAIIAFIVWKLTRKRFSDLDDGDEAIKWPELNRESHIGTEDLSRQPSNTFPGFHSRNASTLDHSEYADPYAVPPLPQFNPNQPYHDDPAAYASSGAGYYDPYRGPIPQTLHDGSLDGHESIPMSTYPSGARSRSPGPGMAYDTGGRGSPAPGRASPGPGLAYDASGRGSPTPGRTMSPGPVAALSSDRRPSPNPQYPLGGQPEMAARNRSPGPNILE